MKIGHARTTEVDTEDQGAMETEAQAAIKAEGGTIASLPARASIKANGVEAMMKEAVAVAVQEVPVASPKNPNNPKFRFHKQNQAPK